MARRGLRLLVVDDDEDLVLLYRVALEVEGHEVVVATTGSEAIDVARGGGFDVMLLDLMLPGIDGYGVLDALSAEVRTAALPTVVVSARVGEGEQIRGLGGGALAYLTKPFSLDRLRVMVNDIGGMTIDERLRLRADALSRLGVDSSTIES